MCSFDDLPGVIGFDWDWWAADFGIELSTDSEDGIANDFGIKPLDGFAPVVVVDGIDGFHGQVRAGALSIDGGVHDEAVHTFPGPATFHEFCCEPVENVSVFRSGSEFAEFSGSAHESPAEVMEPEAIHEDASCEWMFAAGEPASEGESAACGGKSGVIDRDFGWRGEEGSGGEISGRNGLFGLTEFSAVEAMCRGNVSGSFDDGAEEVFGWFFSADGGDAFVVFLEFVSGRLVVLVEDSGRDIHSRIFLQEFLLFGGAFVIWCFEGGTELIAERLFVFGEFLGECCGEEFGLFCIAFRRERGSALFDFGGFGAIGFRVERYLGCGGCFPVLPVHGWVEHGAESVVVDVGDGVIAMIVALGAANREPHEGGADDFDCVADSLVSRSGRIIAAPCSIGCHGEEAGGCQEFNLFRCEIAGAGACKFIAGELFKKEAIGRLILLKAADDIVTVAPGIVTFGVGVCGTFGVRISGGVEPVSAPAFSIMGRGEQVIDEVFPGFGRRVIDEGLDLFGSWGESDEIEVGAADERRAVGIGRESESEGLHFLHEQCVDGRANSE